MKVENNSYSHRYYEELKVNKDREMERKMRMRKGELISKKAILSGAKKEWRGKRRTFQDRV